MKYFFVYYDQNATASVGGKFDSYDQAASFANVMYGPNHKADIRKQWIADSVPTFPHVETLEAA
jgi:hypothetical protein